jgi:mannose/fructose-specific phosphotransferase system component IIA
MNSGPDHAVTPARGVVIAHGAMADAMVEAVRGIAGSAADALHPLSNDGKSPTELRTELDEVMGEGPVVVFVDLQAGSCGMAALSSCRGSARRVVVCGVNLPMLLDFVFHREMPIDLLVERVLEKGRSAVNAPLQGG